ncbi:hypothetical protein J7I90_19105 [Bacillus sp. ISL-57]|nr:hypothetical protein [Bacillus sp. ISL-57]
MGEENTRLTSTESAIEQREGSSGNSSTSSTESGRKGRGRPRGSTSSQKEKLHQLANVNEPKATSISIPGEDKPAAPKKKAPAKKKAAAKKADATQVQMLLLTVSGIIASRPGMEVWNLSAEESLQLAEPISNIIAKNEALNNVTSEHADAFALVMACFMIFVPKFIMHQATKPKKAKQGEKVNYGKPKQSITPTKPRNEEGTSTGGSRPNDGQSSRAHTDNGTNFGGQLSSLIPTTAGF